MGRGGAGGGAGAGPGPGPPPGAGGGSAGPAGARLGSPRPGPDREGRWGVALKRDYSELVEVSGVCLPFEVMLGIKKAQIVYKAMSVSYLEQLFPARELLGG